MHEIYSINDFSVKNLGALESGKIKLNRLTILCGKNNTGKTWLMYSIYGFINNEMSGLDEFKNIIKNLREYGSYELDVSEWIQTNFTHFKKKVEETHKFQLSNIFNSSEELFQNTIISWDVEKEVILRNINVSNFESHLILGKKQDTFFYATKRNNSNKIEFILGNNIPDDILIRGISSSIYKTCIGACKEYRHNAFLIPAERNGLHLFYRELSNRRTALLHHASREKLDLPSLLQDVLGSKYAKPIADYIDWLNSLVDIKRRKNNSPYHHIAEDIKKLIGGKYDINDDGNIEYIPKKIRNKPISPKLDLHLSSSTIKSLFGIWFYLEYQAKENGTLMIDEPELNLHPSNQRLIARIIAKLVNENLNVVVSTHSDYFIREINSLIMLGSNAGDSFVREKLIKKYSFRENEILDKNKIVAYVFKDSTLYAMDIGQEGIIADTFDEEINSLNESSDDIFYSYVQVPLEQDND